MESYSLLLANAFNYSPNPPEAALNNTANQQISPKARSDLNESVDLSANSDSPKSAGKESHKSASEISEFVHENELEQKDVENQSDMTMYEPCECERCKPTWDGYVKRFIGWLDGKVLKKFLVFNYCPENCIA